MGTFKLVLIFIDLVGGFIAFNHFQGGSNAAMTTDTQTATQAAKESDKILLITAGSENCGLCKRFKKGVEDGDIDLPRAKFVWLDIDYSNKEQLRWFQSRYQVQIKVFPTFVAIDSNGKLMSNKSGASSTDDVNLFLNRMLKKAAS